MLILLGAISVGFASRFHLLILLRGCAVFHAVWLILMELISSSVGVLGWPIVMCSALFG